jgi:hypothetical protein
MKGINNTTCGKLDNPNCPYCRTELFKASDPVWICPNKNCRLSNWYLYAEDWNLYNKVFKSTNYKKIRAILFKHFCSGIVPDRYAKAGYKVGFSDAFKLLSSSSRK